MPHKLLIVDDEPMIYQALRRSLYRESDWKTLYANGAEAALVTLESEHVDVVIADENMPGMNGSKLLGIVRQRWPEVIRMMLTGDARIDVVMNAVNRGEIYRFFTKPCNEAELIVSIRDALQMRDLKQGSRQLLETVKLQSEQLRRLEDPSAQPPAAGGGSPPAGNPPPERPALSLGGTRGSAGGSSGGSPKANGEYSLDEGDDVDSLLSQIRKELDSLT